MKNPLKQFSCLSILSFLAVLSLANASASQNPGGGTIKIIDAHTHGNVGTAVREAGLVGHVAMPGVGNKISRSSAKNVITCLEIDHPVNLNTVESDLKSGYGCIKLFLGYPRTTSKFLYAYDVAYKGIYELAREFDVPVVFHTGDIQDKKGKLKYADPLTVDEVAVDFPEVTFVIAHCGNPWYQTAAAVAYKNKNVFLECSALLTGDIRKNDPDQVNRLMIEPIKWVFDYVENPRKIMFGSDYSVITNISHTLRLIKGPSRKSTGKRCFPKTPPVCTASKRSFRQISEMSIAAGSESRDGDLLGENG